MPSVSHFPYNTVDDALDLILRLGLDARVHTLQSVNRCTAADLNHLQKNDKINQFRANTVDLHQHRLKQAQHIISSAKETTLPDSLFKAMTVPSDSPLMTPLQEPSKFSESKYDSM